MLQGLAVGAVADLLLPGIVALLGQPPQRIGQFADSRAQCDIRRAAPRFFDRQSRSDLGQLHSDFVFERIDLAAQGFDFLAMAFVLLDFSVQALDRFFMRRPAEGIGQFGQFCVEAGERIRAFF
ncbi:MAG: hypothetical protein BWZ10_02043 [candidate division BRC1 bacterium ADurb.BinA364]|nr:MAG: hypothetical protein BWZ10_02043 [candidate division BRC1 bacterium ADurb.BinA364]